MQAFLRISGIFLLAVAAVSNAQAPNPPQENKQLILKDALSQLFTFQEQIQKTTGTLQTFGKTQVVGGNAQLAEKNSALIKGLQTVFQQARDESNAVLALFDQPPAPPAVPPAPVVSPTSAAKPPPTSTPSPGTNPPPTPNPAPPASSPAAPPDPATLKKQCQTVIGQLISYRNIFSTPQAFVTAEGTPVFSQSLKTIQSAQSGFSCQGSTSDVCTAFNALRDRLRGYVILFADSKATTPAARSDLANRLKGAAQTVLDDIAALRFVRHCPVS